MFFKVILFKRSGFRKFWKIKVLSPCNLFFSGSQNDKFRTKMSLIIVKSHYKLFSLPDYDNTTCSWEIFTYKWVKWNFAGVTNLIENFYHYRFTKSVHIQLTCVCHHIDCLLSSILGWLYSPSGASSLNCQCSIRACG